MHGTFSVWVWDSGANVLSATAFGVWARNRVTQESLGIFTLDHDLGPTDGGNYYNSAPLEADTAIAAGRADLIRIDPYLYRRPLMR